MAPASAARIVDGFERLLPEGERVLWSGRPSLRAWLRRSWILRGVWIWVGALAAFALWQGGANLLPRLAWIGVVGLVGSAFVAASAVWTCRTTRYLLTDRRLALRIGRALPGEANIPLAHLENAAARRYPDGTGDLALLPSHPLGVGYMILWPHARPWRFGRPEPTFRAIENVDRVAELVQRAKAATDSAATPDTDALAVA